MAKSYLVLEDGSVFEGEPFGYGASVTGEVVFSTGMSGYQESITSPLSRGQILIMTYPLIGNYGINDKFNTSEQSHARALVVREYCKEPSPMYGGRTLDDFLKHGKVPGISEIDTRELVIKIRSSGTLRGAIIKEGDNAEETIKKLKLMPFPSENNLAEEITSKSIEKHDFGKKISVGLLDFGGKTRLLGDLAQRFDVTVFPYNTRADVIAGHKIKGLIVSDGPGDPSHPEIIKTSVKTISELSAHMPIFGTGLGGQVVAVATGAKTYKMKFGHRGSNQPVKCGSKVFITSQNHGFAIDDGSLGGKDLTIEQTNVNDGTIEGMIHRDLPIFTSQYLPDASGDTSFLYERFEKAIKGGRL